MALSKRSEVIRLSLAHRDRNTIRRALIGLFAVMKAPSSTESDAELILTTYGAALADLPTWAVIEAIAAAIQGRGMSQTFAPTVPELRVRVDALTAPLYAERSRLKDVVDAAMVALPPADPSQRQVVADRAETVLTEMRASAAEDEDKRRAQRRAALEHARAVNNARLVEEAKAAGVPEAEVYADGDRTIPVSMGLRKLLDEQKAARA